MEFNETNTSRKLLSKLKKTNITTAEELKIALQDAQKVKGKKNRETLTHNGQHFQHTEVAEMREFIKNILEDS
ncbi:MAG: hypothetical protein WC004_00085 [Candidatus Absconditabacterales bacterium]